MQKFCWWLCSAALVLGADIPAVIPQAEFAQRRAALRKSLDGGVFLMIGAVDSEHGDGRTGFFQEANFYYLTGWTEPGALLVMDGDSEILFLPKTNPIVERYTGKKLTAEDATAPKITGFAQVMDLDQFESQLFRRLEKPRKLYADFSHAGTEKYKNVLALRKTEDARPLVNKLRVKKSANEIAMITRTTDISVAAHKVAWLRTKAGLYEYQVAAALTNVYFENGCERSAYPPIVGSGGNATILHYNKNSRRMDSGELLLMDAGAECSYYATDITRTIPVNGHFTPRQREIYEIVLGAQNAAIAAAKPGMTLKGTDEKSLHKIVLDYINAHGKNLKGEPLGKYFTHGLGHHVGLDVHDPWEPTNELAEGHVITIEPGLYIPEEGIGVRIEDTLLITATGAKSLSQALPRDPDAIEKFLAAGK